jgi:hypothetical protein
VWIPVKCVSCAAFLSPALQAALQAIGIKVKEDWRNNNMMNHGQQNQGQVDLLLTGLICRDEADGTIQIRMRLGCRITATQLCLHRVP